MIFLFNELFLYPVFLLGYLFPKRSLGRLDSVRCVINVLSSMWHDFLCCLFCFCIHTVTFLFSSQIYHILFMQISGCDLFKKTFLTYFLAKF